MNGITNRFKLKVRVCGKEWIKRNNGAYKREVEDICAKPGGTINLDLAEEFSSSFYGKEDTECPITNLKLCGDAKCTKDVRKKHKGLLSIAGSVISLKLDTVAKKVKFHGVAYSRGGVRTAIKWIVTIKDCEVKKEEAKKNETAESEESES